MKGRRVVLARSAPRTATRRKADDIVRRGSIELLRKGGEAIGFLGGMEGGKRGVEGATRIFSSTPCFALLQLGNSRSTGSELESKRFGGSWHSIEIGIG